MKNGCCNLGSLNLNEFVINPYQPDAKFDFPSFEKAIEIAIEGLDTIIDENLERHALKEQKKASKMYRNIGLGVMGYANMLFKLGITYGSKEAKEFTEMLFDFMFRTAVIYDTDLAEKRGAFPGFNPSIWDSKIIEDNFTPEEIKHLKHRKLRNCSLLSIAPTGSIGTMLGVTGGCEPEFSLYYTRNTDNLKDSYNIESKAITDYKSILGLDADADFELPDFFVCSSDLKWKDRIDIQAIMQRHVDTAISSTINLPKEITLEEIYDLYLYAWEKGLKGITIFRSGCKRAAILVADSEETEEYTEMISGETHIFKRGEIKSAHDNVIGLKRKLMTGCGSLHCTAFFDADSSDLVELYLSKGSTGGCNNFMIALSRMMSLSARGGISVTDIYDQLMSTGICPSYARRAAIQKDTSKGSCCPMAIGYAIKEMWEDFQGKELKPKENFTKSEKSIKLSEDIKYKINPVVYDEKVWEPKCPSCGAPLIFEGGCNICKSCGWSKCD